MHDRGSNTRKYYVIKGANFCFQRIQNLYRPRLDAQEAARDGAGAGAAGARAAPPAPPAPDPPPKYTPPPSYSTATGARLLHSLRRSFRTLRR